MNETETPPGQLLRAITGLLDESHELAPRGLPSALRNAARVIDVDDAEMFLVDYGQRTLMSLDVDVAQRRESIAKSTAGRAFRTETAQSETLGDQVEVWVPMVNGSSRIGVIRFRHGRADGPTNKALRDLTSVITELVVSKSRYTDLFDAARRREDLSLAADMQWQLLPPLDYRTPQFGVSGVLEPAYDMGGDSFDYAHNATQLELEIYDAMGHGSEAVTMSAAAVGSVRHSRSHGGSLEEQYEAADELIARRFGDSRFVTAILASYEPTSRVLRWLPAGHLPPVLFRDGRWEELAARPSKPLGWGGSVREVATMRLAPHDRLLLYTDGLVEGRRGRHHDFGLDEIKAILDRAEAEGSSDAEALRQLSVEVLRHNGGDLHDDASMMMLSVRDPDDDVT